MGSSDANMLNQFEILAEESAAFSVLSATDHDTIVRIIPASETPLLHAMQLVDTVSMHTFVASQPGGWGALEAPGWNYGRVDAPMWEEYTHTSELMTLLDASFAFQNVTELRLVRWTSEFGLFHHVIANVSGEWHGVTSTKVDYDGVHYGDPIDPDVVDANPIRAFSTLFEDGAPIEAFKACAGDYFGGYHDTPIRVRAHSASEALSMLFSRSGLVTRFDPSRYVSENFTDHEEATRDSLDAFTEFTKTHTIQQRVLALDLGANYFALFWMGELADGRWLIAFGNAIWA